MKGVDRFELQHAAEARRAGVCAGFIPGLYPRSEALVQATRDLDRGRTTQEAVDEQIERDLAELLSVQQAGALDLLADGMLRWQDHFRPLLEAAEGLETGALTRFLDTNTFYRAPKATSPTPTLSGPLDERHVAPLSGPRIVTLPSPYAFAKGTGLTPKVLAEGVLKPALEGLDAELVVLAEPFFARDEDASVAELEEPLQALPSGSTSTPRTWPMSPKASTSSCSPACSTRAARSSRSRARSPLSPSGCASAEWSGSHSSRTAICSTFRSRSRARSWRASARQGPRPRKLQHE